MSLEDQLSQTAECKNISTLSENTILVTADVTSIPHQAVLNALKEALENRSVTKIPTENLIKMAEFVLKNNLLEFKGTLMLIRKSPWMFLFI